eukprot:SAG31_NODE_4952_length_2837_cov_3.879474_1_plen_87_part_00
MVLGDGEDLAMTVELMRALLLEHFFDDHFDRNEAVATAASPRQGNSIADGPRTSMSRTPTKTEATMAVAADFREILEEVGLEHMIT